MLKISYSIRLHIMLLIIYLKRINITGELIDLFRHKKPNLVGSFSILKDHESS